MSWSIFMGSHDATTPWWMQMLALSRHTWLATIYHNSCLGLQNLSPSEIPSMRVDFVSRAFEWDVYITLELWICSDDSFRLAIFIYYFTIIHSFAIDFFSLNSNNDRKKENSIYREDWFWIKDWFSLFLLISIINCQLKNQQVQLYPLSCCACTILLLLRVLLESFKA